MWSSAATDGTSAFLRTLSLHLQICWQVVPGRKFFLTSQGFGWSIPVIFLAIALSLTGVSFRFGESCHINSKNGVQTFWGPMLAMAAASIVTQTITSVFPQPRKFWRNMLKVEFLVLVMLLKYTSVVFSRSPQQRTLRAVPRGRIPPAPVLGLLLPPVHSAG